MQEHIGERSLFIYKIISFAKENFCNEYMKVEFKTSFQNIIIFNCLLYEQIVGQITSECFIQSPIQCQLLAQ